MARTRVAAPRSEVSEPSTADRFDALLTALEPSAERMALAAQLPRLIRDEIAHSARLRTVEPHTLLVGSYRRHTATGDIKDVDIAILVTRDYASAAPQVVLDDLAFVLNDARRRKHLRNIERRAQRRSIRCQLIDDDFQIDLVPVVAAASDPYGDLWIPDREQRHWLPTRSIGYVEELAKLNSTSGGKLVRLIKLLKYWKDQKGIDRFQAKSFWIEALVVELVREGKIAWTGGWAEVTARAFRALYQRCLPVYNSGAGIPIVPDPMIASSNVAHNWKRDGFEAFFGKLSASQKAAQAALALEETASVEKWRIVFGHGFAPRWTDDLPTAATWGGALVGGAWLLRYLLKR